MPWLYGKPGPIRDYTLQNLEEAFVAQLVERKKILPFGDGGTVYCWLPRLYPLVNCPITMENHIFLMGKSTINGPFSIAMLN